jgi:hypothetical protein
VVATAAGSTRVASGKIDQSGSESQDSDTETTTSQTELASEAIFRREFCKSLLIDYLYRVIEACIYF